MWVVVLSLSLVLLPGQSETLQPDCGVQPIAPTRAEAPILEAFSQRISAYMKTLKVRKNHEPPD